MSCKKIFLVILLAYGVQFASSAQEIDEAKRKEILATYETSQKTIDRINRLMGVKLASEEKTNRGVAAKTPKIEKTPVTSEVFSDNGSMNYLTQQLINVAKTYQGIRYVWGGMSENGMDCSGFVKTAFNTFNINLPRTSKDMASVGEKVNKHDARPGDLIFFKNNGSRVINHVGIIIEVKDNNELVFIHSASSKGVSINSTGESYWGKNFYQVNRIYERPTL